MNKLKYLAAFILPFTVFISFTSAGIWTYSPLLFTFVVIPFLELFFKPDSKNLSKKKAEKAKKDSFFSIVLYVIVGCQIVFLVWFLVVIQEQVSTFELLGRLTAMGIMCGVFGINVGHELGHRTNKFEQILGELLLLTSLETHFNTYHNQGHHYNVATKKDPATARKNEWLYVFWFRSQIGSYVQAWQIEIKRLKKNKKNFISFQNRMLFYTLFQVGFIALIYWVFSFQVMLYFILAAIIGILLLETVNYIEHYGLLRKRKENGKYERVMPCHSWNSDHLLGRTMLFELSRHSDHHYKASKHYQLLNTLPNSPQMITGYPGMMILALIPPLWFWVMNKKLEEFNA